MVREQRFREFPETAPDKIYKLRKETKRKLLSLLDSFISKQIRFIEMGGGGG